MPQPHKLIITLEETVNLQFLANYPCSTDRYGLFGRLDRTRLHRLIGEQHPLVGRQLSEITRFFLDKIDDPHATDDGKTNGRLVEEGERRKAEWRQFLVNHFGGL
ncbi:MAG: hypothetical protein HYV66_02800 [Candidatus Sungbacteria bacterium]|uniref:Uncharacterized protein n=1 Tax=Candidatus Sungiibacteriota bacterium TaxID=2750080 RepID=A0A931YDU7_9BACT|nr:hypothetical protein [Candidatus Sungbacteria bacterium]